jgi:hypothetical protein
LDYKGELLAIAMAKDEIRSESVKVRITPTLKEALLALANDDGRSLAGYIERVLAVHVAEHKPKRR